MRGLRVVDMQTHTIGQGFDKQGRPGEPDRRRARGRVQRQRRAAQCQKRRGTGTANVDADMGVRQIADCKARWMPAIFKPRALRRDHKRPIRRDLQQR